MHNPAKAAVSAAARLIETEADAQTAIVQLTEVMDGLQAVLEQETALVRAGELRQATGLEPMKTELAGHYFKAAERLKVNAKFLSRDLARKASPQVYGASGRTSGPNPKLTQPLALSRML